MKTQRKTLFMALLYGLSAAISLAQDGGETQSFGKKYAMRSNILNQDRTYWVNLPATYDDPRFSPQRYPVPNSPYLNKSLGLVYDLNKEPGKAMQAYERALKLDPKDESIRKKLAELQKKQGIR